MKQQVSPTVEYGSNSSTGIRAIGLLIAMVCSVLPGAVLSHEPEHAPARAQCQQPTRPAENVPPEQWNAFLDAVDVFRECTHQAMEQHQRAATVHQTAAKAAVDEWNLFVRHSLNAPQDFPHDNSQTRTRSRTKTGIAEVNGGYSGATPETELRPQFDVETATSGLELRGDNANRRGE